MITRDIVRTIACLLLVSLAHGTAYGYQNIDECKLLLEKIQENKTPLALDEFFVVSGSHFGVDFELTDDGLQIVKVHPSINADLEERGINPGDLSSVYPLEVNNHLASAITEPQLETFLARDEITFVVDSEEITLSKVPYTHIHADSVWVLFDKIDDIKSNEESFSTKFRVISSWPDERLSEFAYNLMGPIQQSDPSGFAEFEGAFFCPNLTRFAKDAGLAVPRVIPRRFTSVKQIAKDMSISLHYIPPHQCDDDDPNTTCSIHESKYGKLQYQVDEEFEGILPIPLFLEEFPFDSQYVPIELEAEVNTGGAEYVSMTIGRGWDFHHANFIDRFYNSEWTMGENYGIQNLNIRDDWTGNYKQVVIAWFEIQREGTYYIYKLILPITFLLILSWMVFFIKPSDLESRLTISIVVFLSLIAYNFVIADDVPKLGYLTFMDSFILVSYVFAGVPTIQTVMVSYACASKHQAMGTFLDSSFRRFFLILYAVSVCLIAWIFLGVSQ